MWVQFDGGVRAFCDILRLCATRRRLRRQVPYGPGSFDALLEISMEVNVTLVYRFQCGPVELELIAAPRARIAHVDKSFSR